MSVADVAARERQELADLFLRVGPEHPTLCDGWTTRDLVAHLVIREQRPDAAPGILLPPLASWTRRVQEQVAKRDYETLVEAIRTGPPFWNPTALPPLRVVDVQEYFIHHEDVRRAEADWTPRPPDADRDQVLWRQAGLMGRIAYRHSPVGIVQRRPDGAEHRVKHDHRSHADHGADTVTVVGEPGELLLHAVGREACAVRMEGDPSDVAAVTALDRGI